MNLATILTLAGIIVPIATLIGAVGMLLVNKNNAVKILSEAQRVAQTTALDSADLAYKTMRRQYEDTNRKLGVVEAKCEDLIVAVEALLSEDTPENRKIASRAIWAARHAI